MPELATRTDIHDATASQDATVSQADAAPAQEGMPDAAYLAWLQSVRKDQHVVLKLRYATPELAVVIQANDRAIKVQAGIGTEHGFWRDTGAPITATVGSAIIYEPTPDFIAEWVDHVARTDALIRVSRALGEGWQRYTLDQFQRIEVILAEPCSAKQEIQPK